MSSSPQIYRERGVSCGFMMSPQVESSFSPCDEFTHCKGCAVECTPDDPLVHSAQKFWVKIRVQFRDLLSLDEKWLRLIVLVGPNVACQHVVRQKFHLEILKQSLGLSGSAGPGWLPVVRDAVDLQQRKLLGRLQPRRNL